MALLAGAAAGFAAGILFAPEKGEETRAALKEKAKDGYEELKELREMLFESGGNLKDDLRRRILDRLDRLEGTLAGKQGTEETDSVFSS